MIHARRFIGFTILTLLVVFGCLALDTEQASAQGCEIQIEKIAFPADDTPFDFSAPGAEPSEFTLTDPSDDSIVLFIPFDNGLVTLSELVPDGWAVDDIECEIPDSTNVVVTKGPLPNEVTFDCQVKKAKEGVSCSFINILTKRNIPTLSEWSLIFLAVALGVFAVLAGRRKLSKS